MSLDLSVIIPTRDRPEALADALESIVSGSFPSMRYEVMVADNSPDRTAEPVVARFRGRLENLTYLPVGRPGLHEARHAGLAAARTEILVYADDDIVAGHDWLAAIAAAFADPALSLVGGNNLPLYEAEPPAWLKRRWDQPGPWGRCIETLSLLDLGRSERDIPPQYVFGCNFAVRKRIVQEAGGFNPDGLPADRIRYRGDGESRVAAYVCASGGRARFVPGATVQHRVPLERMTALYFDRRHFAEGVSASYALIRACGAVPGAAVRLRTECASLVRAIRHDVHLPALAARHLRWWAAWRHGFRYHQAEAAGDSALLAWVLKATYCDDESR